MSNPPPTPEQIARAQLLDDDELTRLASERHPGDYHRVALTLRVAVREATGRHLAQLAPVAPSPLGIHYAYQNGEIVGCWVDGVLITPEIAGLIRAAMLL